MTHAEIMSVILRYYPPYNDKLFDYFSSSLNHDTYELGLA